MDKKPYVNNFKRRAFELCLAVYRVTKLFPSGETLIGQLRKTSSQIVVLLAQERIRDTILKVEAMKIYLAIAREQHWAKPLNFDLLTSAYSLLQEALFQAPSVEKTVPAVPLSELGPLASRSSSPGPNPVESQNSSPELSSTLSKIKKEQEGKLDIMGRRRQMILNHLNNNKEVTVSELLQILGGVSERTIRNDLADLINRNLIKKIGSKRGTRYLLI